MDTVKDAVKDTFTLLARSEFIYWCYTKLKSNIQKYIDDTFEASQIIENLWLGSLQSSCNREALKERDIDTIVSAILGATANYPFDFDYERAKLKDVDGEIIIPEFKRLLPLIHNKIVSGKGVLCHCHAGRSRSASIVAAYLIRYHNMTAKEALAFIKEKRSQIDPNPGYVKQLEEFEQWVKEEKKKKKYL